MSTPKRKLRSGLPAAGREAFGGKEEVKGYEKRIADLERVVGQKEVEIALLTNFLKGR